MLFLVEDNGYAISVPVECQTAGGSISRLVAGFPDLFRVEVDGMRFRRVATRRMARPSSGAARAEGPALVHAHVIRPYSHSLSDDERLYRTEAERAAEAARDPLIRFPEQLVAEGLLDRHELQMHRPRDRAADSASHRRSSARGAARAAHSALAASLFRKDRSGLRRLRRRAANSRRAAHHGRRDQPHAGRGDGARPRHRRLRRGRRRLRPRARTLARGEGQRRRLQSHRRLAAAVRRRPLRSTRPIAEAAIVGRAIGMATRGLKPVAEIQFFDYIWPAMMQIRDETGHVALALEQRLRVPGGDARAPSAAT